LGDEYLGNKTRGKHFCGVTPESRQAILEKVIPRIKELREEGQTFQAIAVHLNEEGYSTPRGSNFSQSAVWNLAKKYLEGALQA
jgi:DNA invertase Pin-like site-specific DNA recombinase